MAKAKDFFRLEKELEGYKAALNEAADRIIDQEVSSYPVFVAHQHEIELGVPIIEKEKVKGNWSINASSLEEFTYKGIIFGEKVDDFKKVYKEPQDYFCFFILSELGAQFIFLPRS